MTDLVKVNITRLSNSIVLQHIWNSIDDNCMSGVLATKANVVDTCQRNYSVTVSEINKNIFLALKEGSVIRDHKTDVLSKSTSLEDRSQGDWYCFVCHQVAPDTKCKKCQTSFHHECNSTQNCATCESIDSFSRRFFQQNLTLPTTRLKLLTRILHSNLTNKLPSQTQTTNQWTSLYNVGYFDSAINSYFLYSSITTKDIDYRLNTGVYTTRNTTTIKNTTSNAATTTSTSIIYDLLLLSHNCAIIYGCSHAFYKFTARLVRALFAELDSVYCEHCYLIFTNSKKAVIPKHQLFTSVCQAQHPILWGLIPPNVFWPFKLIRDDDPQRFFGIRFSKQCENLIAPRRQKIESFDRATCLEWHSHKLDKLDRPTLELNLAVQMAKKYAENLSNNNVVAIPSTGKLSTTQNKVGRPKKSKPKGRPKKQTMPKAIIHESLSSTDSEMKESMKQVMIGTLNGKQSSYMKEKRCRVSDVFNSTDDDDNDDDNNYKKLLDNSYNSVYSNKPSSFVDSDSTIEQRDDSGIYNYPTRTLQSKLKSNKRKLIVPNNSEFDTNKRIKLTTSSSKSSAYQLYNKNNKNNKNAPSFSHSLSSSSSSSSSSRSIVSSISYKSSVTSSSESSQSLFSNKYPNKRKRKIIKNHRHNNINKKRKQLIKKSPKKLQRKLPHQRDSLPDVVSGCSTNNYCNNPKLTKSKNFKAGKTIKSCSGVLKSQKYSKIVSSHESNDCLAYQDSYDDVKHLHEAENEEDDEDDEVMLSHSSKLLDINSRPQMKLERGITKLIAMTPVELNHHHSNHHVNNNHSNNNNHCGSSHGNNGVGCLNNNIESGVYCSSSSPINFSPMSCHNNSLSLGNITGNNMNCHGNHTNGTSGGGYYANYNNNSANCCQLPRQLSVHSTPTSNYAAEELPSLSSNYYHQPQPQLLQQRHRYSNSGAANVDGSTADNAITAIGNGSLTMKMIKYRDHNNSTIWSSASPSQIQSNGKSNRKYKSSNNTISHANYKGNAILDLNKSSSSYYRSSTKLNTTEFLINQSPPPNDNPLPTEYYSSDQDF